MNNLKVFVLMAGLTALFVVVGDALGGREGALLALLVAAVSRFVMYFGSASMVLRADGARVVTPEQAPDLYALVG